MDIRTLSAVTILSVACSLIGCGKATPSTPTSASPSAPAKAVAQNVQPSMKSLPVTRDTVCQEGAVSVLTQCETKSEHRFYASPATAKPEQLGIDRSTVNCCRMMVARGNVGQFNTEAYDHIDENGFRWAKENPLSTFSIDVDTASYANVRRFLTQGQLPPAGAVRIEEFINYFPYAYAAPTNDEPFAANVEIGQCPWQKTHRLVRIGLKAKEIAVDKRPPSNLVFLLDVSGSMQSQNKLPLVKRAMTMLVDRLTENDRVAMVVYAGETGVVLPSTCGQEKEKIRAAIEKLGAGGCTNGAGGIAKAYEIALENFIAGGTNRILLATDGDFNGGVTNQSELIDLITAKAKSGVFLTVLGFGMGNYKDATLEKIADKGNGNYAYIDTIAEARKSLIEGLAGTLITVAKDVKIQIEFNPAKVSAYRLLGYENRMLQNEDFKDDTKDAGEIGAGHTVTALYEIVPVGVAIDLPKTDELIYQKPTTGKSAADHGGETLTLKLRYKQPEGQTSREMRVPVVDGGKTLDEMSGDFKFAAAVAEFGMVLRNSKNKGDASYAAVLQLAKQGLGSDEQKYRAEFVEIVKKAAGLTSGNDAVRR